MKTETITLAGGCFWCTEAIFTRLKGVKSSVSGYTGGTVENPTYEQVCSGETGHAEAIQIEFDPSIIALEVLLDVFFNLHDPTTLNRQGNDAGTQYRSAIFYRNDIQKVVAEKIVSKIENLGLYENPIVTEITPFTNFYKAEDYHQQYYDRNKTYPYCDFVIGPKIHKLMEKYKELIV